MSASTLKVGIVIAALVGGVFVIAKAFPGNTSETLGPISKGHVTQTTPSSTPTPSTHHTTPPPSRHPNKTILVQVLNGSGATGLAGLFTQTLKNATYKVKAPSNAPHTAVTIVYYRPDYKADAEALQARYFADLHGSVLKKAPSSVPLDVKIQVVLGADFAASTSPKPSTTPSASASA